MAIHWSEPPELELHTTSTHGEMPVRIYDSRNATDPFNATGPISDGITRNIFVDVFPPHTKVAVAAALTITVVNTVGGGFLKVYPADRTTEPDVSTINWFASGQVLASGLVTRLGAALSEVEPAFESRLNVTCSGGSTDFIIDVTAWWLLSTV